MTDYSPSNNTVPEVTRREHDVKGTGAKKTSVFGYNPDTDALARVGIVVNPDGTYSLSSTKPPRTILFEDTGSVTYMGEAVPGTATSAATWRIRSLDDTTGSIKWANGVATFSLVWDNRASYTYS